MHASHVCSQHSFRLRMNGIQFAFGSSVTRNMITFVWTIHHVKLAQSTTLDTSLLGKLSAGFIVLDALPLLPGVRKKGRARGRQAPVLSYAHLFPSACYAGYARSKKSVKQTYDDSICYAGTALTAGTGFFTSLKKPKWFSVQGFWAI